MGRRSILAALTGAAAFTLLVPSSPVEAQSLRGSRSTVARVYETASERGLHFYRTSGGVKSAAEKGRFVRLTGNAHYKLHGVSHPYLTASTRTFVERIAAQYHAGCGEQLVVTSAIRPLANQPRNSSDYSVHPTGIAVDLRKPSGKCLTWLRKTLLALEERKVIDGTEERSPPHFHVVVFPAAYDAYIAALDKQEPRSATPVAVAPKSAVAPRIALATVGRMPQSAATKHRVRKGDSLWSIARRYDTSVATIRKLNPSAAKKIIPGQTLVVSSAAQ